MRALVLLAAATASMGTPGFKEVRGNGQAILGDTIQEFGLKVSQVLHQDTTMAISPLSISSLLSMLMMGTVGQSNLELRRVLRFPDTVKEEDVHLAYQGLLETLSRNGPNVTLNVANGLFLQTGTKTEHEYTQNALTHYNSVVTTLNFKSSSHEATQSINEWVKRSTSGMIPHLFNNPLSPSTTFVAVNTVFFDGKWETPFKPSRTGERDFDTGNGKIKVPIMSETLTINYADIPELNSHMAALPYKGGRQAMFIILPKGPITSNLGPLEQMLTAGRINEFINRMTRTEMRVWLPKMRLSFKTPLRGPLTNLQVGSIFDPATANFSRLSSDPVFVNDIIHETVIEITEQGTKAVAATAAVLDRVGSSRVFVVNRPAIIFIRDIVSGIPLFWAKLVQPDPIRDGESGAPGAATPLRPVTGLVPGTGDADTPSRPVTSIVSRAPGAATQSRPVTGVVSRGPGAARPSRPVTGVSSGAPGAAAPSRPVIFLDAAARSPVTTRRNPPIVFG